ncbi:oligo-1,6-glucosidase/alpha-glucosidase [Natronoarchaeum philippinense]|uniref:Oligo-1,6-glucosidase/alpha-glucosidase n=1 Tax=Natronoarchaeum philippinense TaxID=558529 RepID=A0A285N6C0_NATPI|nr:alpha-glucosidase [Natronoarchaeum philippinense]SNZ04493.1 oligo-1,6-glucosidase/alpha-glucosidase [Natronoarchaeum philippinense]
MTGTDADIDREWWKEAVVYQVYPRSFNDSDGDGIGDIPGIVEKVEYLDDLGVDVVWLNPVYESPMADNGYDIADYQSIHPEFGTMDDWERLLEELHDRDMRLIMDLVVNHTSDEHEWFRQSREGDAEYDDYYHWRSGDHEDDVPNNWDSFFSDSAWSYDDERGEYYLHLFDEKQPDLNWRNEDVRDEVFEMMNWWLEKGIDGFRMDVVNLISKTEGLPDGDPESGLTGEDHFVDGPNIEQYFEEMYDRTLDGRDVMTVGEMINVDADRADEYVGEEGFSMLIHFEHMGVDTGDGGKWTLADLDLHELKRIITDWQETLDEDGWNCLYLSNHDQPRAVSRFGDDGEYRVESAKMLGTFLFTLQGTPFVFQGQEIGMTNADWEREEIRDVEAENHVEMALDDWADSYEDVRPQIEARSRDNARTPMQWTDGENAGFSEGDPWIKVNERHDEINVEAARADDESIWHYYRELIDLRDDRDIFVYGDYELLLPDHSEVFAYRRTLGDEELIAVCNFFGGEPEVDLAEIVGDRDADLLVSNYDPEDAAVDEPFALRPYETRVYDLS